MPRSQGSAPNRPVHHSTHVRERGEQLNTQFRWNIDNVLSVCVKRTETTKMRGKAQRVARPAQTRLQN